MVGIEAAIYEPERMTNADNLYLTQLNGIIRIFKSLEDAYECFTIFRETKNSEYKADEVYERLFQGFEALRCGDIKDQKTIDISARIPVQLELCFRSVVLKHRQMDKVFRLYESDNQRFCRFFYFDFKVGFNQVGLPTYERWETEQAEYLKNNLIRIICIVSECSNCPVTILIVPKRI